jgi:hypothetical protein
MALNALRHSFTRVLNIMGVKPLMVAMQEYSRPPIALSEAPDRSDRSDRAVEASAAPSARGHRKFGKLSPPELRRCRREPSRLPTEPFNTTKTRCRIQEWTDGDDAARALAKTGQGAFLKNFRDHRRGALSFLPESLNAQQSHSQTDFLRLSRSRKTRNDVVVVAIHARTGILSHDESRDRAHR